VAERRHDLAIQVGLTLIESAADNVKDCEPYDVSIRKP
jgi:hypothetical protein